MSDFRAMQAKAKWEDLKKFQEVIEERIDFYNNNQKSYMTREIKKAWKKNPQQMLKFLECLPYTERIINDKCVLFSEEFRYSLMNGDNVSESDMKKFAPLFTAAKTQAYIDKAYHLNKITKEKVGILVKWIDDALDLEILTADKYFVTQDPINPKKIVALYYQIGVSSDSPTIAARVDKFVKWTAEAQQVVEMSGFNPEYEKVIETIPNPLGYIPVAWFEDDVCDNWYYGKGQPIVETNKTVNITQTKLRVMIAFQTFSTMVTSGMDVNDAASLTYGENVMVHLPLNNMGQSEGDVKFITPNPKLSETKDILEMIETKGAQSEGISADSYRKDNSKKTSGYHQEIDKQDVLNKAKKDRKYYRESIKKLINIMLDFCRLNPSSSKYSPTKGLEVSIDFGEVKFKMSETEKVTVDTHNLMSGLTSKARILMRENPDIKTTEEAINILKEIEKENEAVSPRTETLKGLEEEAK